MNRRHRTLTRFLTLVAAVTLVATGAVAGKTADVVWPSPDWPGVRPAEVGLDASKLERAKRYALSAGGSGMVLWRGRVVLRWGDQKKRYDIKSATKSFGATMLGIALKDGRVRLDVPARRYHPSLGVPPQSNADTGWLDEITLLHLATHTAGFEKPGGYGRLLFRPGTHWHYSDGGPNWLAECLTLQYGRDLQEVLFERVFGPLGISRDDLRWRKNQYRPATLAGVARREFGAGIHANVEALVRLGYLYLRRGQWKDRQILSEDFVRMASHPVPSVVGLPEWTDRYGNASDHYGLLWWNNADGTLPRVPRDAFWAWGLYDSLIVVVPSLDLVVVRAGERGRQWPRRPGQNHYDVLEPFLEPIVETVRSASSGQTPGRRSASKRTSGAERRAPQQAAAPSTKRAVRPKRRRSNSAADHRREASLSARLAPYPPSPVITSVQWAPASSIRRAACGSDNWPLTWADDDALYTAYGDGWGFEPRVEKKLSLGLAKVLGRPTDFRGVNVRSRDLEQLGQGAAGRKASGILMVDGVLYLWVRNAGNSQLAWSTDHGKTWKWADWKFTTSFGAPTFLNFGRNYSGARDDYVYVYSPDSDSAYRPADRMVLCRVPKDRILRREAYEFFQTLDEDGQPIWTRDVAKRGAVFVHRGRCYRSGITYNAGLKRYLWCQVLPESRDPRGPRFQGGFGIYDAPEPWGPWTTVYFTEDWDVGPGETSCFPTKWMNRDGRTLYLVFSGNDCFSVRRATLTLRSESEAPRGRRAEANPGQSP